MDRYLGGQFPYAAFFWPALVAASAAETASSMAAHFLELSSEAGGDRTPQEPEGATPSKIELELRAVRLRDFMVQAVFPPCCTPLALHGAAIADLAAGHSLVAALRGAGIERLLMAIGARPAPTCDFSELRNIAPVSMSLSIVSVAWLIS
jgi:hypothetical protein